MPACANLWPPGGRRSNLGGGHCCFWHSCCSTALGSLISGGGSLVSAHQQRRHAQLLPCLSVYGDSRMARYPAAAPPREAASQEAAQRPLHTNMGFTFSSYHNPS